MTTRSLSIAVLLLAGAFGACAKSAPMPGDSVSADGGITLSPPRLSTAPSEARESLGPIESRLYPPELVMEHQGELAITDEQKRGVLAETERAQSDVLRLQWELQGEKEKLVKLLDSDRVEESKVQEIAARVMDRESKIKATHLGMLVRVKNILSREQQAKLRELRASVRPPPPSPPDAGARARGDAGHSPSY